MGVNIEASERVKEKLGDHNPLILQSEEHFTKGHRDTHPALIVYTVFKTAAEHGLFFPSHFFPLFPTTIVPCFFAVKQKVEGKDVVIE